MAQDRIADALRALPLTDAQRADLWDAYTASPTTEALTRTLTSLAVPQEAKAALWDLKAAERGSTIPTTPTAPADEQSWLGRAWQSVASPAVATMEAVGRPLELLMGTAAGTAENLRTGQPLTSSLASGFERGKAAYFEPEFADSQLREGGAKVIEAAAPEFAKANPLITAAAGFVGDVTLDPTNLLAGAGFLRKGGMAALKGLGASEQVAKRAMLVPVGEGFKEAVKGTGQAIVGAAAESPILQKLMPSLPLKTLIAEGRADGGKFLGLSAEDMKRTAEAKGRAGQELLPLVQDLLTTTTEAERELMSLARAYPASAEAASVAANPRLQGLLDRTIKTFDTINATELGAKLRPATRELELSPGTASKLAALSNADRLQLEQYLREGTTAPQATLNYISKRPALEKLAQSLYGRMAKVSPTGEEFMLADPDTLKLLPTGVAEVSTETPNYLPGYRKANEVERMARLAGGRRTYDLAEAEAKTQPFREALTNPALKFEGDIATLLQRRYNNSVRALTETQLVRDYATEFGSKTAKPGYTQFSDEFLVKSKLPTELADELRGLYLPTPIVNDLQKFELRLADPVAMDSVFRQGTRLFKTLATTMRLPAHQANNFLGNVTNMYAGGDMSPAEVFTGYQKAFRALWGEGAGSAAALGSVKVGNRVLSPEEVLQLAREMGAIGAQSSQSGIELSGLIAKGDKTGLQRLFDGAYNPANPDNAAYQYIRNLNQRRIEDPAKLALFVHELKKGKSAEQASVTVRKVLFDYAELSPQERKIRDMGIPFYTWMRKNIPLQLATLVERPSKISHQGQFLNLFREWSRLKDEEPLDRSTLRSYMEPGEMIPLPSITGAEGSPLATTLRLPFFDLSALAPGSVSENVAERINPIVTAIPSLLLQRDVLTGKSLDQPRQPNLAGRLLPEALGGATPTAQGLRQSGTKRLLTDVVPLPGDPLLRILNPPEDAESAGAWEALRLLGLTPVVRSPQLREQALADLKRDYAEQLRKAKQAAGLPQ